MGCARLIAALAILGALAIPALADACSCTGAVSSYMNARAADLVFLGTVTEVETPRPWMRVSPEGSIKWIVPGGRPTSATFEVTRAFGGRHDRQVAVTLDGANCDLPFNVGEVWLVYASERDGVVRSGKCGRSRLAAEAGSDLEYLEGIEQRRPQALVHGDVMRSSIDADGQVSLRGLPQSLQVVAVGAGRRFAAATERGGAYQLVLPPGDFEVWVERSGERASAVEQIRTKANADYRLMFVVPD